MDESSARPGHLKSVDPLWMAMSQYRRRRFKASISLCDQIINDNGPDVAALFLKTRAVTIESYVDDADFQDEEGAGEMVMDENATATMARPGTSLNARQHNRNGSVVDASSSLRPVSSSGRPLTGFVRPGSSRSSLQINGGSSGGPGTARSLENVLRPGTSRPATTLGREVRMSTASIELSGNQINTKRLNMQSIGKKPPLALAIAEHLLYLEANPKTTLELGAECSKVNGYVDWWWKYMIGKAYFKLGLFREAERQLKSSIENQSMVVTHLELMKVYLKLDVPKTALKFLYEASLVHPYEPRILLAIARIHDELGNHDEAAAFYKKALSLDAANVEAIACLAAHHYYISQPEVSLRYYRRLIQMVSLYICYIYIYMACVVYFPYYMHVILLLS
jgi:tetratricopeptide repeat protein 8